MVDHQMNIHKSTEIANTSAGMLAMPEETFDCPLCQSLLYEPITTSCGHSFCKDCILRAMDHDNKCPLCRNVISVTPEYGISRILAQVIQSMWPEKYKERKEEKEKELTDQSFNLPLFLLGHLVLFPSSALPLHVFEPRYRLMIRRCLEGGKRFGVVPYLPDGLGKIGTVAFIENHYMFPDGRSLVATTGEKRFKVLDTWDQDGYTVAKVEYIEDDPITEQMKKSMEEMFPKAKELTRIKLASMLPQVEEKIGPMPETPIEFVWWLASVAPINAQDKYKILSLTNAESRLNFVIEKLSEDSPSSATCTIS